MNNKVTKRRLNIRKTCVADFKSINSILTRIYPETKPYPHNALLAQISHFPDGQFVAEYDGEVIGFCMTFIVSDKLAMRPHTWDQITGHGFASRHDPLGNVLYGMEICVDPAYRGKKIGERLYNERKKLCQKYKLKGIVFGARIPGYSQYQHRYKTPQGYVRAVKAKKIKDPTLSFQIRNNYTPVQVLKDYLPSDQASCGYAVLMKWDNPLKDKIGKKDVYYGEDEKDNVRICTINFQQRRVRSFDEFRDIVLYFIEVAADYKCDFVLFPEFVTMPLLAIDNVKINPVKALEKLGEYTEPYIKMMGDAALKYNINIIAGTHMVKSEDGGMNNICHVFLRNGEVYRQSKIHPTPSEVSWWNVRGGDEVSVIKTDRCPIGVLICYDAEFPELARYLVDQGAKIIFVPFSTDTRQGYLRVRYCAQARAIENQCYVAMSGNTGNLPRVYNMDINYAQSCILTPADFPFPPDGIAADTTANSEMVAIADLSVTDLVKTRNSGTVTNLKDRRRDLYQVTWHH